MDTIEDDITRAMNDLNMGRGQAPRKELKQGLLESGEYNSVLFAAVIDHIKATKTDYDRISPLDVLDAYNKRLSSQIVSCDYCRGGGWLKVILLKGMHDGRERIWVYNFRDSVKHMRYIKANPTFKAHAAVLPCTCENGSCRNVKNKRDWFSVDMRGLILQRSIRFKGDADAASSYEDYYQDKTVDLINGKIQTIKDIKEYPDIPALQKLLMNTLASTDA